MIEFKSVVSPSDLDRSMRIIQDAFITVADQFGLTRQNCPTNPAFIDAVKMNNLQTDIREFFLVFYQHHAVGFVAIEKSMNEPGVFFIEKLAVIPEYRHRGIGREIMQFAEKRIKESGGQIASIAIIDEHEFLKDWYKKMGYMVQGNRKFDHLPFTVCFMKKEL